jgi:hypothetical protein
MSWRYTLVPAAGVFDERALREMRAQLDALPSLVRGEDLYCVFPTVDARNQMADEIARGRYVRDGKLYVPGAEFVQPGPREVLFSLYGDPDIIRRLAEFITWCQSRWPSVLKNQVGRAITADALVKSFEDF